MAALNAALVQAQWHMCSLGTVVEGGRSGFCGRQSVLSLHHPTQRFLCLFFCQCISVLIAFEGSMSGMGAMPFHIMWRSGFDCQWVWVLWTIHQHCQCAARLNYSRRQQSGWQLPALQVFT